MSSENSLNKINKHFSSFLGQIRSVRKNIEEEGEYTRGYLECMKDMIEASLSDEKSEFTSILEKRMDMKYRGEVLDELLEGLENLSSAYNSLDESE